MKLVTGIEAIQSGKRFRQKTRGNNASWITPNTPLGSITSQDLLDGGWEIEPEPREFFVALSPEDNPFDVRRSDEPNKNGWHGWIKVREVIE